MDELPIADAQVLAYTYQLSASGAPLRANSIQSMTSTSMKDFVWKILNAPPSAVPPSFDSFRLQTPPKTDLWRPSRAEDVFTAPIIYTVLPVSSFRKTRMRVSADWKTQFDQGGLVLVFPRHRPFKWIKTGIEMFEGRPYLATVGTDDLSDWSLAPLPRGTSATIEAVREEGTLWIYALLEDGGRLPLREVKWAFAGERAGETEMWVGVYCAKPTPEAGPGKEDEVLTVEFEGFSIEKS